MCACVELLRHFGSSSIFQSASGPARQIFKAKNHLIRVRTRMFTGLFRILRASGMFQTIYNRPKFVIIQIKGRTTTEHTPTETTRRKSATQRQRPDNATAAGDRRNISSSDNPRNAGQISQQKTGPRTRGRSSDNAATLQNSQDHTGRRREHSTRSRHTARRPALIDPAEEIPTAEQKPFKSHTTRRGYTTNAGPA